MYSRTGKISNGMKKIKILFSIGRFSVGGAEKLLIYKLKYIDRNQFEPHVLTLFPETKESLSSLVVQDIVWHQLKFRKTFDFFGFLRLARFLKKEHFDVVVTELFSANLLVRMAAFFVRSRAALVSYEHNLYPNKSRWQILVDRFLAYRTKAIIVDAASVKTFTAKQENISEEKFFVLYHPPLIFEDPQWSREALFQKFNIPLDAQIVLNVSRLVPEKGHEYLMRAAAEIIKKRPNVYFLIVGWGPLEQILKSQIEALKLEKNVILTGRMDIKDVLPYADVYVEPAIMVDVGIAMLEAMKAKKAIVASNVGEIPVFVYDGENGFLVAPKDVHALIDRISAIVADQALQIRMGERSEQIIAPYTIEKYMQSFESLVKQYIC